MTDFINSFLLGIGFSVVGYMTLSYLAEILRCVYWTIWEWRAIVRHKPDLSVKPKALWKLFWWHLTYHFEYTRRGGKYYTHGYWPWEQKQVFGPE